jgi:hypothetical protein
LEELNDKGGTSDEENNDGEKEIASGENNGVTTVERVLLLS